MSFTRGRLRRLEGVPACRECGGKPPTVRALYPGDERPEPERCPGCGRERVMVLRVLYEGEGDTGYEPL